MSDWAAKIETYSYFCRKRILLEMTSLSATAIFVIILLYFAVLFAIGRMTSRKASSSDFFRGGKKSPWYVVALSMIGTSISGVTFVSVPGMVQASCFSYIQMVLGFLCGYAVISYLLLPLYYRMNLSSIYGYLGERFGRMGRVTGSVYFSISKYLGCGVRMYLTAAILQYLVFDSLGIPFILNVAVTMTVVWAYTVRGGVRTIVWVDLFQTFALIASVVMTIFFLGRQMGMDWGGLCREVADSGMSRIWFFDDVNDKKYFFKQFLAGMFTTVAINGLDQDMMQKNLSCRNLRDAQKNVLSCGILFLPVNLLFLALGVLLYIYSARIGIAIDSPDNLFPTIATGYLPPIVGVMFVLGLVAAAFSSSGSALTALTSSFSLDILKADIKMNEREVKKFRVWIHSINAVIMGLIIFAFQAIGNGSVINAVYTVASYTYGPILGLYAFGMTTTLKVRPKAIPYICAASPALCFLLSRYSEIWFDGYQIGFELLLINGLITFLGLLACSGNIGQSRKSI